jgi:histidine racemase
MNTQIFKVAGGNLTALVPSHKTKNLHIAKDLLKKVEQVGFIVPAQIPTLSMMGNELCINATLAFASSLEKKGKLITSGINTLVSYSNSKKKTTIKILIPFKKKKNVILFEGIGFAFFNKKEKQKCTKKEIKSLCSEYKLHAFSGIIYEESSIVPFVYVKKTDSFVQETSCGSGSIAFSIYSGIHEVTQPTQEKIYVERAGDLFSISAKVERVEDL